MQTWIEPEEKCYPGGGMHRKGRAFVCTNEHAPAASALLKPVEGSLRAVRAGIPDTFFSIPARLRYRGRTVKGYLSSPYDGREGELYFTPEAE